MTDTLSCHNCGTVLPPDAAFCTKCGTKVEAGASSETASSPTSDAAMVPEDVTRIETPGLHDTTRVIPEAPPTEAPMAWSAPAASPAPERSGWAPPAAPSPPPPWQPPPTAATEQRAWQPPPQPPQWAREEPAGAQPWSGPSPPSAPPSQWQQPAPDAWPTAGPTPVSSRKSSATLAAILAFLGAILLVVGVFTLWLQSATGSSVKLTGWEMITVDKGDASSLKSPDPAILLGIAAASIAVGGLLVAGRYKILMRILLIAAGIGVAVVLVRDYLSIKDAVKKAFSAGTTIDFQYGFWIAAAGGVVLIVAALVPAGKDR